MKEEKPKSQTELGICRICDGPCRGKHLTEKEREALHENERKKWPTQPPKRVMKGLWEKG